MAGAATKDVKLVKPKSKCCKDDPRCKKCPVVLKCLAREGLVERQGDKYLVPKDLPKKRLKAARGR